MARETKKYLCEYKNDKNLYCWEEIDKDKKYCMYHEKETCKHNLKEYYVFNIGSITNHIIQGEGTTNLIKKIFKKCTECNYWTGERRKEWEYNFSLNEKMFEEVKKIFDEREKELKNE